MQTILISPETRAKYETETYTALLNEGLDVIHIRKPFFTMEEMQNFLSDLPEYVLKYCMIHSHHQLIKNYALKGIHFTSNAKFECKAYPFQVSRSCHSVDEVELYSGTHDYVFLSPIFDSISKPKYTRRFAEHTLKQINKDYHNIIALGGIEANKIGVVKSLGFNGYALLGSLWKWETVQERVRAFKMMKVHDE